MKKENQKLKVIRFIQHLLAALIAFTVAYSIVGSSIVISGLNGDYTYNLYESDRSRDYEESYLFNNILGNNLTDALRLVAVRTQLETGGVYDEKKKIDVTAYVNRGTNISGDYITAVYYLSDLLKWAQGGFEYKTKTFTDAEAQEFLSPNTIYTHLKTNVYSGGMNSYLNSQIEDNSLTFEIAGSSAPGGGEHTYLLSRYQTVDGKNIEDIVSTWEEYSALCSYVQEAAQDLMSNYGEYNNSMEYFDYLNTNLRYYISRSIGGKNEVYTNVKELSKETTGKDIKEIFKGYGKYLYYCPYELNFETNTLLNENTVRSIIRNHSYAYPDQVKIYVAVDTVNYPAEDSFAQGKDSFSKFMPYKTQLYILAVIATFLYVFLAVLYTRSIPRKVVIASRDDLADPVPEPEGPKFYTEAVVLIGLMIMIIPMGTVIFAMWISGNATAFVRESYFPFICAAAVFVMSIGFLFALYGIITKIKEERLWNDSFLRFFATSVKNLIVGMTDNANVIIRTWVPYVFFVVMNILLFKMGVAGIFVALILDVLIGIYMYKQNLDRDRIIHVIDNIRNGDVKAKVYVDDLHSDNIRLAEAVNSIGEGIDVAVNKSMKDEKLKADLITNVSHDIKTPLTSIINYVDLIKREDIDNERVKEYVQVLEVKSQKLKQLTEDLVEASKISSGNISIQLSKINFVELVNQTIGEFYEKLEKSNLQVIFKSEMQEMYINADARHLWRVVENLLNNVCKYALSGTRVYMDMRMEKAEDGCDEVAFSVKNISASELNVDATELTERFIRGDESRTTEGSGLGLSIAKNLTTAQGGTFDIRLDGDLFKVIIKFKAAK